MQRVIGFLILALRRLRSQAALMACVMLGITVAVAFASAIPSFVNSAQLRVLRQTLKQSTGRDSTTGAVAGGEPLYIRFSYLSAQGGRLTIDKMNDLDAFMRQRIEPRTILPTQRRGVYMRTDDWAVRPAPGSPTAKLYTKKDQALFYASIDTLDGIENHIQLDDGVLPVDAPKDGSVPLLVHRDLSQQYGIRPGDTFSLSLRVDVSPAEATKTGNTVKQYTVLGRVAGIWTPVNADDDYWFILPSNLSDGFVLPRGLWEQQVAQIMPDPVDFVLWQVDLNDAPLRVEQVDALMARMNTLRNDAFTKRPGMSQTTNVTTVLAQYQRTAGELTLLMIAFAAPLIVIVFYFIVLVSGMVVRRQESELITFRSRGASPGDALALYSLQSAVVGLLSFVIGLPLGYVIATLMSGTRSFLNFAGDVRFSVEGLLAAFDPSVLPFRFGVAAAIGAVIASLLPAAGVSRATVVSFNADRGRNTRPPLWQRFFLDILLLVPVAYGYLQLQNQGSIAVFGRTLSNENPLRDPVRYLLPMLLMTSLALIVARFFPLVMRLFASLLQRVDGRVPLSTPTLLAARELGRSPKEYLGSLLLLIIATGIATFGASTAKTLDGHLFDSTYFQVGADLRLEEDGVSNKPQTSGLFDQAGVQQSPTPVEDKPEYYSFMPVEDHKQIDGVLNFARMTTLSADPRVARPSGDHKLMAVDWLEFSQVMKPAFRADYASDSFGALMNDIGSKPNGMLVPPRFMAVNQLKIGDKVALDVYTSEGRVPITYTVTGTYLNFPTIEPNANETYFIADIDYTFANMGKAVPYDVLLATKPDADGNRIADDARRLGFLVKDVHDARQTIIEQQQTPERQGLFGILTAGFFAALILTIVGFVLYAVLSFRRRAIELGVLRTLGLSSWQMAAYLVIAQLALVAVGTAAGSGAGILASRLFIPFFQVKGELVADVPSFFIRIAWDELTLVYLAIGLAFGVAMIATLLFLRRLRAFEAIKLGMVT